eukprot:6326397-Amphidinium_carterae.1
MSYVIISVPTVSGVQNDGLHNFGSTCKQSDGHMGRVDAFVLTVVISPPPFGIKSERPPKPWNP